MTTPSRLSLLVVSAILAQPLVPGTATAQHHTGSVSDTTTMTAIFDRLEHLALTAANPSVRVRATLTITDVGRLQVASGRNDTAPPHPRYPGTVARLATIYRNSADPAVRDLIVERMPALAERSHAIAFLSEVASERPTPNAERPSRTLPAGHDTAFSRAYIAIYALTRMGEEGRAALARLDVDGMVRDPEGKAYLARLAKEGYKNDD